MITMDGSWIYQITDMPKQILTFLPGYYWDGNTLQSTGLAIKPSQHIDKKTGDVVYYVRPLFAFGGKIGLYIKRAGLVRAIREGHR